MDLWEEHHDQGNLVNKKQKHEEDRASHVSTIATMPSKENITTTQVLPTPPPSPETTLPSSSPPPPPTATRKQRTTAFWPGRWRPVLTLPTPSTPTERAPIIQNNDNHENKDTNTTKDNETAHGMGCLLTLTLVLIVTHIYMIYHLVRASRHLAVIESFCK